MTRKEAINMLKSKMDGHTDTSYEWAETVRMAIKALEQKPVLDKIKAEIEQIEINGHIRDIECFRAGINTALNVINKYKAESEVN